MERMRKDLKKVRKEITDRYIFEDKISGTTLTHYYPSESEPGKRYYISKFINGSDRLMYNIYAPRLIQIEEGKDPIIYYKIELKFCIGHTHYNGRKFSEKVRVGSKISTFTINK